MEAVPMSNSVKLAYRRKMSAFNLMHSGKRSKEKQQIMATSNALLSGLRIATQIKLVGGSFVAYRVRRRTAAPSQPPVGRSRAAAPQYLSPRARVPRPPPRARGPVPPPRRRRHRRSLVPPSNVDDSSPPHLPCRAAPSSGASPPLKKPLLLILPEPLAFHPPGASSLHNRRRQSSSSDTDDHYFDDDDYHPGRGDYHPGGYSSDDGSFDSSPPPHLPCRAAPSSMARPPLKKPSVLILPQALASCPPAPHRSSHEAEKEILSDIENVNREMKRIKAEISRSLVDFVSENASIEKSRAISYFIFKMLTAIPTERFPLKQAKLRSPFDPKLAYFRDATSGYEMKSGDQSLSRLASNELSAMLLEVDINKAMDSYHWVSSSLVRSSMMEQIDSCREQLESLKEEKKNLKRKLEEAKGQDYKRGKTEEQEPNVNGV